MSRHGRQRRQLGIRGKVLAVLVLPVLVVALTAAGLVAAALIDARTSRELGRLAAAQDRVLLVQAAVQAERLLSLTPPADAVPGALAAARAGTDREIAGLAGALARTGIATTLPGATHILDAESAAHSRLLGLRRLVDGGGDRGEIRAGYAAVIDTDVELPGAIGGLLPDRGIGGRLAGCSALGRAVEASERARLVGLGVISGATPSGSDLAVALDEQARALAAFRSTAPAGPDALTSVTAAAARFDALAGSVSAGSVSAVAWSTAADQQAAALRQVAREVAQDAVARAQADAVQRELRAAEVGSGSVAVVGLMLLLALIQSRRITAAIRSLAGSVASIRHELPAVVDALGHGQPPQPLTVVEVMADDEVGEVAAAFRELQATVLQIAREQVALRTTLADTFVNVAQRNQALIGRQLSLIDRLERTEQDPDALENLFRLDHLATRMRRNAESLLVLAGQEPGRRVRRPMPLSDVIRIATGEIEHFDRVYVATEADPAVVAHLCLPVAHLLAELLENATAFSDPGSIVAVRAATTPHGVRVTVTDQGIGLTFDQLSGANDRLNAYANHPPETAQTVAAQRLGFYVVARLAARLTARVRLAPGLEGGTVAVVELPSVVFTPGTVDDVATEFETGLATGQDAVRLGAPVIDMTVLEPPVEPPGPATEPPEAVAPQPDPATARVSQPDPLPAAPAPPSMEVLPRRPARSASPLTRLARWGRSLAPSRGRSDPSAATSRDADPARSDDTRQPPPAAKLPAANLPAADPPAWQPLPSGDPDQRRPDPPLERRSPNRAVDDGTGAAQRMRSHLASEALAELSLLAAYRPQTDPGPAPGLVRRPPTAGEPAATQQPGGRPLEPEAVRTTVSGFAAGLARARRRPPDPPPDRPANSPPTNSPPPDRPANSPPANSPPTNSPPTEECA